MWDRIDTSGARGKDLILDEVEAVLEAEGYQIEEAARDKPWGAYFRLAKDDTEHFLEQFFTTVDLPDWALDLPFDPKILVVAPDKRLSWQWHFRRGEVWSVVSGPVGVYISDTDQMPSNPKVINKGGNIQIKKQARHRLAGLETWGFVAEIWVHTDPDNPSDEDDITRVEDDFGR